MEDDVAAGRPILSALCVNKTGTGIPQPGFFRAAQTLGVYSGDFSGPEAHAFHARELQRVLRHYRVSASRVNPAALKVSD